MLVSRKKGGIRHFGNRNSYIFRNNAKNSPANFFRISNKEFYKRICLSAQLGDFLWIGKKRLDSFKVNFRGERKVLLYAKSDFIKHN